MDLTNFFRPIRNLTNNQPGSSSNKNDTQGDSTDSDSDFNVDCIGINNNLGDNDFKF